MVITFGFAGGFTGGWFASKGDPFWTLSGGLAGVISVSAGADVYHPSLAYLLATSGAIVAVWVGQLHREEAAGRRRGGRGGRARRLRLLRRVPASAYSPAASRRASTTSRVSFGGQLMGMLDVLPARRSCPRSSAAWVLKKINLLRVPPEVELEGLDIAEFQQDFYPEFERQPEVIILPTGEEVEAGPDPARRLPAPERRQRPQDRHESRRRRSERGDAMIDSFPYEAWDQITRAEPFRGHDVLDVGPGRRACRRRRSRRARTSSRRSACS